MSDRLAVMNNGKVEQVGTPQDVYDAPETRFVAEFLGVSNVLDGVCDGRGAITVGSFTLSAGAGATREAGELRAVIRPERVVVEPAGTPGPNRLPGMIERVVFVGSTSDVRVRLATGELVRSLVANGSTTVAHPQGTPVSVHLPTEGLRILRS